MFLSKADGKTFICWNWNCPSYVSGLLRTVWYICVKLRRLFCQKKSTSLYIYIYIYKLLSIMSPRGKKLKGENTVEFPYFSKLNTGISLVYRARFVCADKNESKLIDGFNCTEYVKYLKENVLAQINYQFASFILEFWITIRKYFEPYYNWWNAKKLRTFPAFLLFSSVSCKFQAWEKLFQTKPTTVIKKRKELN